MIQLLSMSESIRASEKSNPRWRLLAWPVLLAITIFVASGQSDVAAPPGIPSVDKLAHFLVFGLMATLVVRPFFHRERRLRSVVITVAITSLYGGLDEIHQSFTPGRSVEVFDWVADTSGAVIAAVAYAYWPGWRDLLEHGMRRRPVAARGRSMAAGANAVTAADGGRTS